jgi:hypothetical protein
MHSTDSGVCMDMFTKNIFPREVTGKRCAKFAHAFESKYTVPVNLESTHAKRFLKLSVTFRCRIMSRLCHDVESDSYLFTRGIGILLPLTKFMLLYLIVVGYLVILFLQFVLTIQLLS